MKTTKTMIEVTRFENGNLLLAISEGEYFVQTTDGILTYTEGEMKEVYDYVAEVGEDKCPLFCGKCGKEIILSSGVWVHESGHDGSHSARPEQG